MGSKRRERVDCSANTQWVEFVHVAEYAEPLGLRVVLGKRCWHIFWVASGKQIAEFVLPNMLTFVGEDTKLTENWKHALKLCKRASRMRKYANSKLFSPNVVRAPRT